MGPVIFVVNVTIDERPHLLKVLSGFVKDVFEGPLVLMLVHAPQPLIGEAHDAEGI